MPRPVTERFSVSGNGKLWPSEKAKRFFENLMLWSGRDVVVTLASPPASRKQRGYYFGVVLNTIHEATILAGHPIPVKALHRHFSDKYLPVRVHDVWGETIIEEPSITSLDTTTMHDYIEAIRSDETVLHLLSMTGLEIPDPDPDWKNKLTP